MGEGRGTEGGGSEKRKWVRGKREGKRREGEVRRGKGEGGRSESIGKRGNAKEIVRGKKGEWGKGKE